MKQTISQSDFHDAFIRMDRKENFSWEARELLFDYFEECDPDMELDVIAICCEFYENDLDTVIHEYRLESYIEDMDDDEKLDYVRDYLQNETSLIGETSTGFIYASF